MLIEKDFSKKLNQNSQSLFHGINWRDVNLAPLNYEEETFWMVPIADWNISKF